MIINGRELTRREAQLAELVARGLSNKEIAHIAGLTPESTKTYISRLYRKLGSTYKYNARLHLALAAVANENPVTRLQLMADDATNVERMTNETNL